MDIWEILGKSKEYYTDEAQRELLILNDAIERVADRSDKRDLDIIARALCGYYMHETIDLIDYYAES